MGRKNNRKVESIKPLHIRLLPPQPETHPRRGEVWYADLGDHTGTSVQGGERPVMIISNDVANENADTVTIVPITSKLKKPYLPTHVAIPAEACGNLLKSMALCEQVTTVSKSELQSFVGRMPEGKMAEIEQAVRIQLAI